MMECCREQTKSTRFVEIFWKISSVNFREKIHKITAKINGL